MFDYIVLSWIAFRSSTNMDQPWYFTRWCIKSLLAMVSYHISMDDSLKSGSTLWIFFFVCQFFLNNLRSTDQFDWLYQSSSSLLNTILGLPFHNCSRKSMGHKKANPCIFLFQSTYSISFDNLESISFFV